MFKSSAQSDMITVSIIYTRGSIINNNQIKSNYINMYIPLEKLFPSISICASKSYTNILKGKAAEHQ